MAIPWAVRGTSLDAYRSLGRKDGINLGASFAVAADVSAIGGSAIVAASNNTAKTVLWSARYNTPNGRNISILSRYKPGYAGAPTATRPVIPFLYAGGGRFGRIELVHTLTTGALTLTITNEAGTVIVNGVSFGAWTTNVAATWYDIVLVWDGTAAATCKLYIDGVLFGTITPTGAFSASWTNTWFSEITMSGGPAVVNSNASSFNELVIWDTVIDPTANVTLTSGAGLLNGAARTAFVDATALDGENYTDPGVANVLSTASYTFAGVSQTGTWQAASAANVKTGVAFGVSGGSTGTYDGSDRWTDPGVANTRSGTAYKANSTTNNRTGTLAVPAAGDVRSGTAVDAGTGTLVVPSLANTKTGVAGDGGNGTYDGSDRWSDPGITHVESGISYKANSTTDNRTGTYVGGGGGTTIVGKSLGGGGMGRGTGIKF